MRAREFIRAVSRGAAKPRRTRRKHSGPRVGRSAKSNSQNALTKPCCGMGRGHFVEAGAVAKLHFLRALRGSAAPRETCDAGSATIARNAMTPACAAQTASDNDVKLKSRAFSNGMIWVPGPSLAVRRTGPRASTLLRRKRGLSLKRMFLIDRAILPFSIR